MDKGWGLTLDSSNPIDFFLNKPTGFNLSPKLNHNKGNTSMFSGNEFKVEEADPRPSDHNRMVVDEVDFFSNRYKSNVDDIDSKISRNINMKKENSDGQSAPKCNSDVNTGLHLLTANTVSESTVDDGISSAVEDKKARSELAILQAELERMNTENERLRAMLSQVRNNYSALQTHLLTLMQQQRVQSTHEQKIVEGKSGPMVPRQFLDLGPNATAETDRQSHSSSEERTLSGSPQNNNNNRNEIVVYDHQEKASFQDGKGLIEREESPELEGWVPNKVPKLSASKTVDQATEATMRKARVSVRARSEATMISDGCQWRKYGQKMAKGNPCPRAYYRCTMAVGCPVRKQVQRCADDRTILITTYEGNHNHPLPPAAMAMASTTSSAATMLLSGSMPSSDGLMNPNFLARSILPSSSSSSSSSIATISASAPFPTITLDLTHSPTPLQLQTHPNQFQVPFSGQPQNFPLSNQSKFSGLQLSQDTVSAATAAITADPNFTAALAAAISSIIGGAHPNNNNTTTTTSMTTSNSNKSNSFQGN